MDLGDFVHEYRKEHRISMDILADRCGLSKSYISFLEAGKNPATDKPMDPTFSTLKKLAKGMDIPLDELISCNSIQSLELNSDETRLISNYRKLSKRHQETIDDLAVVLQSLK